MDQNLSKSKHQKSTVDPIKIGITNLKSPLLEKQQQITTKKFSTERWIESQTDCAD